MKIRKQILIPLLLVDAIALYFFLTTIEAWIFWLAALILVGSLWWLKKAIQCGVYIDPIWLNIQHIDRFMKQNRYMMKFFTHIFTILPQMGPRCTPERKFTN